MPTTHSTSAQRFHTWLTLPSCSVISSSTPSSPVSGIGANRTTRTFVKSLSALGASFLRLGILFPFTPTLALALVSINGSQSGDAALPRSDGAPPRCSQCDYGG